MNLNKQIHVLAFLATLSASAIAPARAQTLNPAGGGGGGYMWSAAFHPTDPNRIVFGADIGGIYQTYDYGQTWERWTGGLANPNLGHSYYVEDLIGVSWDGGAEKGFFAATRGGIYYGDESGGDWLHLTPVDDPNDEYYYQLLGEVALPLPFSCFDFDETKNHLYAGAGYDRFTSMESLDLVTAGIETVWKMNLSGSPTAGAFNPMSTSHTLGSARDISVKTKNGTTWLVVATNTGVYMRKSGSAWSLVNSANDCWSVHITNRGSLYGAFATGAVKVVPNINQPFGDIDWDTVDRTSGDGPYPDIGTRLSLRPDLINLTVVDGTGTGDDILMLGGWTLGNELEHGGLYRCEVNGTQPIPTDLEWIPWIYKETPNFHYTELTTGNAQPLDVGYQPFVELDMPVEPAVFAGDPNRILVHTSARAHVYDPSNDKWVQAYSTDIHGDGTGWQSHGWNELSTRDVVFFKDTQGADQIITGNGDIGVLRSTGDNSTGYAFEYHNPRLNSTGSHGVHDTYIRDTPYVDYREDWNGGGEGAIFAVTGSDRARWPAKLFMWRETDGWLNITESIDNDIAAGFAKSVNFHDFALVDDQTVLLSYTLYGTRDLTTDSTNPINDDISESGILKGTYASGAWTWQGWNTGLDQLASGSPYIYPRSMMVNPATGIVFLATAFRNITGETTTGGLYFLADPAVNQWSKAIGNPGDFYLEFQTLTQSNDGQVMYVGTSGQQLWSGRGAVLRCGLGPGVDGTDLADWTDITTNNPFGFAIPFGHTLPFMPPGNQLWTDPQTAANRLTYVTALAVSPYENDVVFAGLYHGASLPQEELWVHNYNDSEDWEPFPPTSTLKGMSVQALAFPPDAASKPNARLVCGTNGQELYWVSIPKPSTGGGSGCPYVYVYDGTEYREDNTILAQVPGHTAGKVDANVVDRYVLQQPLVADGGKLRVEIREFENERSYIDKLDLIAVDHPSGTEIAVIEDGRLIAQREWVVPIAATMRNGTDVLASVASRDAASIRGHRGDHVDLVYRVPASGLIGLSSIPGEKEPPIPTTGSGKSGIEALLRRPTGRFVSLGMFVPRERLAPRTLSIPAELLVGFEPGEEFHIRLVWHSEHTLDFAGLLTPVDATFSQQTLASPGVQHSAKPVGSDPLKAADGRFVELAPGETLALEFDAPAAASAKRSYVLVTEGHYENLGKSPEALPAAFRTYPNVPNPFNPTTTIRFDLPSKEIVSVQVYSVTGQLVRTIWNDAMPAGRHAVEWDGRNNQGSRLASGVYFYRVSTRLGAETRKMTLLK